MPGDLSIVVYLVNDLYSMNLPGADYCITQVTFAVQSHSVNTQAYTNK